MTIDRSTVLAVATAAALVVLHGTAHALTSLTVDKCLASQIKIVGKGAAALTGCYAKGAAKGLPTDGDCLAKGSAKVGPPLDKLDAKLTCIVEGTGAMRASDASSFAAMIDGYIGHAAGKCDGAKTKLVGKYVAALTGCFAKAAGKTGTVDPACASNATTKLGDGITKAEDAGGCTNTSQLAFLQNFATSFALAQTCHFDPSNPQCATCGNGVSDPDEPCDASASSALWNQCGPEFACVGCNCACPTTVVFSGDANAPETLLDSGWTGISHRARVISNGDVTVQLSCAATSRPCGTCTVSGPITNPHAGAGQLDSRRCSTDSSKKCTSDAVCAARTCLGGPNDGAACAVDSECPSGSCPPAGSCNYYFGSLLPLAAGGVTTCVANQFDGAVTGTAEVESGEAATSAVLTSRVYGGVAIDFPCPRCTDAGGVNDGVNGGTCDAGPRAGHPCDANGSVPDRPDFGRTSLDCPSLPGALLATLSIDLTNATDTVVKTLTANSLNCTGSFGDKCLCDTCNNANAQACAANADCPISGGNPGICGGRRCLGGSNVGAPCTAASECPGGGVCVRSGEPTRPSSCLDDTAATDRALECSDPDGDGEGECTIGPLDQTCTVASGHAQRGCTSDVDCGGSAGTCVTSNRKCFLTGGGTFQPSGQNDGTDTLTAVGMEDTPVRDASNPTLGSVFCVAPTAAPAVNNVAGLPGPGRVTLKGHAVAHP